MLIIWKNYKHSKLATFISVVGALTLYGGVMLLVCKEYVPGIVTAAVGIAIRFGAEKVAQVKAKNFDRENKARSQLSKKCPHCGNFVPVGNKVCNYCSFVLIRDKVCLRCGRVLKPTDKFCNDCGYQCQK